MSTELLNLLSAGNIIIFIIVFTRVSGMLASAPLFATYPIPMQVKVWLCALIAFIIYPMVANSSGIVVPANMVALTLFLVKEFFIGFLIGYLARFLFIAVQVAGQVAGLQMGIAMGETLDPASGEHSPIVGEIYSYILTIVFIATHAYQWLFTTVYKSFSAIPPGMELMFTSSLVKEVLVLFSSIFIIAFQIILPIFCVLFVSEVLMGFIAKMMPQMNIFMVALPFKIGIGLVLILLFAEPSITFLAGAIEKYMLGILTMFMGG